MKILLLSVQFKTTKKRVLNWKKKFSQKLIFLNFNILKVQNITYVNEKCQKCRSKLSACLYRSRYIYTYTHTHTHTPFSAYTSRYRATLKACVDFNSCKAFSNSFCTCFIFA